MKKLFTLLTLMLCSIGVSWAEDAKVTWTTGATGGFDSAADPTTITTDISYSVGAGLTESGTQAFDGTTYTKFNQNTGDNKGSNSHDNGVSLKKYVDFKFTPVGGKFTPTKVSFNMIKIGTGDPNVYVDVIDGAGATINVADNKTIIKNDAAAGTSTAHEYNVSGAATSDGAVTLRIIVGKLASGKSVGITNVKIEGTIETGGGTPAPAASTGNASWKVESSTSVAANTTYVDDEAMTVKTVYTGTLTSYGGTFDGIKFEKAVQIRVNAAPSVSSVTGTEKSGSTPLVITPKYDVDITFYYRRQKGTDGYNSNDGKDMYVVDQAAPTTKIDGTLKELTTADDYEFVKKTVSLKKGKTYTVCANGTTVQLVGFNYEWSVPAVTAEPVVFDFSVKGIWNIPTEGSNNKEEASFTDGKLNIKLSAANNYKQNVNYLILGKANSYLEFPAFDFDVKKIEIEGTSGASPDVKQNIYVGETAVSKETTGAKNVTNIYEIDADKQTAGTIYRLKVTSAHNTQITKITVYPKDPVVPAGTITKLPQILTFPDYNMKENASYLVDDAHVWTADVNGAVWTFRGFNNQNNAWNYIACGRKNTAVTTTITSPRMGAVVKDVVFTVDETANVEKAELVIYDEFDMTVGEPIDITSDWAAGEVDVQVEGDIDYVYQLVLTNKAGANGSTKISKVALYGEGGYTHILKAANIAAFNALTANDVAELTLTDAKVLAAGNKNIIVEDATGRLNIYDIALDAKVGQVLNGKLIGSYTLYNGMNEMKKAEKTDVAAVTITDGEAPVAKAVTLAEAQTADNALALVTIADAVVKVEGKNTYAVIGEEQMQLYDTFKSGYKLKNGDKINSMTGIVIPYKDIFELAPRTLEDMDIEEFVEPTPQPQPGETGTATYAVQVDETHKAGESVDVKTADEETVATLTFGFEGGQDFKAAKAHSGVEGFVAFTEGNGENGNADAGTTYIITPQYDGEIEVGVVLNAGKSFFVLEDGTALADYNGVKVDEKLYGTYKFNVAAAKTYKVYCTGSKLGFYGFNYTFTKPVEPQPAGNDRKWTFTEWSAETVANLKADAAASSSEGWSDIEKKDATAPTEISKDNCFWAATTPNEDGQLTANGVVIEELKGLKFNADYTAARSLAIAVNYPTTSLGDYAGPAYLWLGGKNMECFTIPNVTAGSTITIEVESHKPTDARGIRLYKQFNTAAARSNRAVDEANLIGELIPTTKEAKTFTVDEDCDVVVKHTNGCHIYTIEVKGTEPVEPVGPVEPTIEDGIYDLTPDMFKTWDGIAADSKATEAKPNFEQHVNENVNPGTTVYGNGSVSYLTYANITAYDKLVIEGTPGMQIRILLNRLEVGNGGGDANGGALNEINKTLDATGVAEISLADMDAARLNAIKLGWGSAAGVIYKMAVIKGNIGYVPTGINTVKANAFENGTVYNLRGQKVTNPTKGLYIINGKKVMVK